MNNKLVKLIKYLIGWPLTVISLFFVFKIILGNTSTLTKIDYFNPFLFILSIILFLVYFVFRSLVWKEMLSIKGHTLSFKDTFFIWSSTEIKRYIPGNIWSFIARAEDYKNKGVERKTVYNAILLEAQLIVLSCLIISLTAVPYVIQNEVSRTIIYSLIIFINILFIAINGFNNKLRINNKFIKLIFPEIPFVIKTKLLLLSIISFTFFGLATYFAGFSIIYLNPYYLQGYLGFFVFSLLAGYISFVTPMGLGVREGFITVSLSKFMAMQPAGIFAIFSRIVFIISELIFLIFSAIWYKLKSKYVLKIENIISKNKYKLLLLLCILTYILYFTVASFLKYDNFYTGRFDLGNMDQTVWNTIHGRIFEITDPNGTNIMSRLGFHADLILILISPLYFLWSDPKMLLILQSVVLALGSLIIYLISKKILQNNAISVVFSFAYLINPAINYTNLYDFHPVTLATTFLLATFYFFINKKYWLFLLFAILSGLTKEHVWAVIAIFGLSFLSLNLYKYRLNFNKYNNKELLLGIVTFLTSILLFYYLIWHAIPNAKGGNHFALSYYSDFGNNATSIGINILSSPFKILQSIITYKKLLYLFGMFSPLGFISLFSPLILIYTIPDFAVNLLSNNPGLYQIYYQYTAVINAFIFISAIYGVKFLNSKFKFLNYKIIIIYLLFTSLMSAYNFGPLPFAKHPSTDMFTKQIENKEIINNFIASIPEKYSIAATNNLGSHLSRRQLIYTIPVGIDRADVILFLLNDSFAQPSLEAQKEMAKQMEKDQRFVQIFKLNDFVVFEKKNLYLKDNQTKTLINLFPYSIPALSNRSYQKNNINIEKEVPSQGNFKSYIISYISDGLKQYALMDIPDKNMPKNGFPVLILNHGYVSPKTYSTTNSYSSIANFFANKGYLVLKPDYRGNGNSEISETKLMRFTYPIDVLNLLSSIESIKEANPKQMYIWSHSMGGEVTLKVIEVSSKQASLSGKIKGAVLWAPVTDPIKWFSRNHLSSLQEATITPFPYSETFKTIGTPEQNPKLWQSLSPLNYLKDINIPILIQHGTSDNIVPYNWSVELKSQLDLLNKNVKLISYPNDDHNLPIHWSEAILEDVNFFSALQKNQ